MLRGRVVRVGAGGLLRRQLEHLGPKRSEDDRDGFGWCHRREKRRFHRLEIGLHERVGLAVFDPTDLAHDGGARHPDAQHHPATGCFGDGVRALEHHPRGTVVDIGDARRKAKGRRCCANQRQLCERVTAKGLPDPQSLIAERFDPLPEGNNIGARQAFRRKPNPTCVMGADDSPAGSSCSGRPLSSGSALACTVCS